MFDSYTYMLTELPPTALVYDDSAEWAWRQYGDPVVHIELRNWADVVVIAPLDANSLAKLALGICDNLLTTTIRAMDLTKPLLFCPTMNDVMWNHPITQIHINTLKSWGLKEVPPIVKLAMCGEIGMGGIPTVETIVNEIKIICGNITHFAVLDQRP
ncbi:hypothetical protein MSG28_010465 [Choristoneura fumiferana]|uniref:Uncharacterized protein n=2 Tax=Choristoneura fumiferana TaxID=7141 RepID=A0ACC0KKW0_CHOFU|nr:hypothetical protein MSG28_010465 [Choristoneura fumiferana]